MEVTDNFSIKLKLAGETLVKRLVPTKLASQVHAPVLSTAIQLKLPCKNYCENQWTR